MDAEQALQKLETHFCRLLSEVFLFESLYSNRSIRDLLATHLHDLIFGIQRPLMDSIVLCICRLFDPAETCGKKNITFFYLAEIMPNNRDELIAKLKIIKGEIRQLTDLRNQIIGHADLGIHTNDRIEYSGASHDEIIEILLKITSILEYCSQKIRGEVSVYGPNNYPEGGPDALFQILKKI